MTKVLLHGITMATLALLAAPSMSVPLYDLTDLGTLAGGYSKPYEINDLRQVVGISRVAGGATHAFLWDAEGGMVDLGTPGGTTSYAYGINDDGQVVGYGTTLGGATHAWLWSSGTGMQDLGTAGGSASYAYDINESGQIVGYGQFTSSDDLRALLWDGVGGVTEIPGLGMARAINNKGQVAGGGNRARLWTPGTGITDIGDLGGDLLGHHWSSVWDINDGGQVSGSAWAPTQYPTRAFLWDTDAGIDNLGSPNLDESYGYGVDMQGRVVGYAHLPGSDAILWADGEIYDLSTLIRTDLSGWELGSALDINSRGDIVGWGRLGGQTRAFLLTEVVVPEPSSLVLVIAGVLGLAWARRAQRATR